ncbi:MAG: glycosyltransferase [Candidatus Hydrogenedentes bacterium]|nr:glycosyltransferase [Candidatus Hydrogenedentota bacterium]
MTAPRLQISPGMRRYLDYPKFQGPVRMLVLETEYFFDASWARAAAHLGWQHASVPSAMTGGLSADDVKSLFTAIAEFKPDFILTSNYAGMDALGLFARFFEDARIPYVSWFTDTPRMILFGRQMHISPWSVAATWERSYTPYFERLGFEHIHFMPLATDPEIFNGAPLDTHARAIAFVGTSMLEQTHEAVEKHAHLPGVKAAVIAAFEAGQVTRENYALGMEAIVTPSLLDSLNESERRNVELLVNYQATFEQRLALVQAVQPLGLEVRGDLYWKKFLPEAGGAVGYFDDLAPYYRNTAINLNTTSLQMRYAVNQRVFDCPAAGGFLLTDDQADLHAFFDVGREAVAYGSLEDLVEKVAYYQKHPDERRRIVEAAQRRIAAEHTHAHRLAALAAFLRERFAS